MANASMVARSAKQDASASHRSKQPTGACAGSPRHSSSERTTPRYLGAGVIQRECSCGGACPKCREGASGSPTLNTPGDPFEREADRVADSVMSGGALQGSMPVLSTLPAPSIGRSETASRAGASPTTGAAAQAVSSGGRSLNAKERGFFEPRFGRSLSRVRVHEGHGAGEAAQDIGATAYAYGQNIAFAPGAYAADTPQGQRLMAHELAHTMQQGNQNIIRRTCPTDPSQIPEGGSTEFEAEVDIITALPAYVALDSDNTDIANHIIDGARASTCPMYYISRLRTLFETELAPPSGHATNQRRRVSEAVTAEQTRLRDPDAAAAATREEDMSADPSRVWETRTGEDGVTYQIDAADPANVVVRMQVYLEPAGAGTAADVANTLALEDAIEKHASTFGYTVDVVFVDAPGPGVFEAGVNPEEWTNSGNWVGLPRTMAHEGHHNLGLEDRYNYIVSHHNNTNMDVPTRLWWFREQMVRPPDAGAHFSMMANQHDETTTFDDTDVCDLVGGDFETCVTRRIHARSMAELEAEGSQRAMAYDAASGWYLREMRQAWQTQCLVSQGFSALTLDPVWMSPMGSYVTPGYEYHPPLRDDCANPPEHAFGTQAIVDADALRYPLTNPHEQDEGVDLPRRSRAP